MIKMSKFLSESELNNLLPQWMQDLEEFRSRFRKIDISQSVLLVIDMQNDFLLEDGLLATWGGPVVVPRLQKTIEVYRHTGRPVIFTRHCYSNPELDGGATAEWWGMDRDSPVLNIDLPGSQIHADIAPREGDPVIVKHRYNAFHESNLESILKRFQTRDVIISGVASNCCCEATAHEAFFRDYHIFFLADGCGGSNESAHIATLRDIAFFYGTVLTCDELNQILYR